MNRWHAEIAAAVCLGSLIKKFGKQKIAITSYALYSALRCSMSGVRKKTDSSQCTIEFLTERYGGR